MRNLLFALFLGALSCHCVAAFAGTEQEQVEHGLRAPVLIKNRKNQTYSLLERMKYYQVPGVSIAIVDHGKVAWTKAYGNIKNGGSPVTNETLFQAGSVSKAIAALGALYLVQEGILDLDTNLNQYLTSCGDFSGWRSSYFQVQP